MSEISSFIRTKSEMDCSLFCENLLHQMTLEEKIGQMVQSDLSWKQDIEQLLREGRIGSMFTISDVERIHALQKIAVEESRLHIPLLFGNDVVHGYRTIFPIPLALACAWDPDLVRRIARVVAYEASVSGTNWTFAPMVDICRDSRWGRIAEGAGEDPYLGSQMARAWVEGFQDEPLPGGKKIAACVKHYAAYGGAEAGRDYNSVDLSERRLREEYLPPYRAAVEAGVKTLMTSFNDLNGVPATINAFLLRQILRKEWGFEGMVVSDYDSIGELILHGVAADHREAALRSAQAGVEMDMMGDAYHFHLADLVRNGVVPESLVDEAALRILKLKFNLGLFEDPYTGIPQKGRELFLPETLEMATRAAEDTVVLLKNENSLLPLPLEGRKVALIGPLMDQRASLLGSWSFDGRPEEAQTLQEALKAACPSMHLLSVRGCEIDGGSADFSAALEAARKADVVILALGESEAMSGEAHCRAHLGLPGHQQALVEAVAACGKPAVAVVFSGRPLAVPWLAENIPAILWAWQGGTCAAQALVNLIRGRAIPSAKLTASFPRSEGQLPIYYYQKSTGRPFNTTGTLQFNEAHKSIYLDESNLPLYPFGFGLSYTTFEYRNLVVETPQIRAGEKLVVSATIANTGAYDGKEIVQLYVRDLVGCVTRPVKELKGFQKIFLKAGEEKKVRFELPAAELAFLSLDLTPVVEPGSYHVWIAPDSQAGLQGSFSITGD